MARPDIRPPFIEYSEAVDRLIGLDFEDRMNEILEAISKEATTFAALDEYFDDPTDDESALVERYSSVHIALLRLHFSLNETYKVLSIQAQARLAWAR